MKSPTRHIRRRRSSNDSAAFRQESAKESPFFSTGSEHSFFQPAAHIQRKEAGELHLQRAEDKKEEEDKTLQRQPDKKDEEEKQLQRAPAEKEEEKDKVVQKKESNGQAAAGTGTGVGSYVSNLGGKGHALPPMANLFFSSRMGHNFSQVRLHTDEEASESAHSINAQAYTLGNHIVFAKDKYRPETPEGKQLLAHELTHTLQQNRIQPRIQRRLFVSGANNADPVAYLTIVGDAGGFRLGWSFANPRVSILGNTVAPATSQNARSILTQVINHPTQHAEMFIGTHQPGVFVGAFPGAGNTVQDVDIDDIQSLNASLPGQGTAKAFHEMFENFNAHGTPGLGAFGPSHAAALERESNVAEDQGIAGRRLNDASIITPLPNFLATLLGLPTGPGISYDLHRQIFTHYFLDMIQRRTTTAAGTDFEIIRAVRTPKTQLSQLTIDNFASGSNVVPGGGAANLAATLAVLNANPASTLLLEGFADSTGTVDVNLRVSRNRADAVQAFFIANGITANRIAVVGRGETNFVGPNNTPAGRALNRRVVLTVHN